MKDKDLTHLRLMLDFAQRADRRIKGVGLDTFLQDDNLQDAILYAVGQIGENANAVSEDTRMEYPAIYWGPIIGLRNRVFHSYGDIDMRIVYNSVAEQIPVLIRQLQELLESTVRFDI